MFFENDSDRLEKLAEAHRQRVILEAEAEAESLRLKGEAEAFAIEAKAKAEAEQMAKKAAAFREYQEAAKVDMILNTLPKVRPALCQLCFWKLGGKICVRLSPPPMSDFGSSLGKWIGSVDFVWLKTWTNDDN